MRPKSKDEKNLELRREAEQIVAGVERYSSSDRTRREAEVSAAFPPMKKETKAAASAMKSSTKTATKAMKTVAKEVKKTTKAASKTSASAMKSAAKMSSKGPTPAGMSTGRHDGDLC